MNINMIKKYLPFLFILIGIILLGYGGFKYLNPSRCLWIEKKGDLVKIDTITKTIENEKMSRLAISYKYKVGSITYHGVFLDDWKKSVKDDIEKLVKDKKITIYHHYINPNLSLVNRPKEGIYRMAIGLICLIFGLLLYFSTEEITNKITINKLSPIKIENESILKNELLSETPIN